MRALAMLLIIATSLSTPACVGSTIHGLDEAAWFELLASGRPLPFSSGDTIDYDALSKLGPGAILFIAMRAGDAGDGALAVEMLGQAVLRESGRYRTRSVALLADALLAAGDGSALVSLCQAPVGAELPPYRRSWLEASGLVISGSYAQAAAAIDAMRLNFPAESARDSAELAAMALEAGYKAGRGRWADEFASITAMHGSTHVYAALAKAVGLLSGPGANAAQAISAVGARTFQLAEARSLVGSRDYGPAVVAFRRYVAGTESPEAIAARLAAADAARTMVPSPALVSIPDATPEPTPGSAAGASEGQEPAIENDTLPEDPAAKPLSPDAAAGLLLTLPRAAASDAAKAFMAASRDEGAAGFARIVESTYNRGAEPARAYFDAYWNGRFLRAAERWQDAEAWFTKATGLAATAAERDAAAWYAVELAWKRSPFQAIAQLGKAMLASRNPLWFSDLIEPLSREALVARDGKALVSLDAALEDVMGARDEARLSYLCARAAQAGIITDADVAAAFGPAFGSAEAYAEARLRKAYGQKVDDWYRLAAAYRLGEPLVEMFSTVPAKPAMTEAAPAESKQVRDPDTAEPPEAVSADEYALALARFGLGSRLRAELGTEYSSLSWDTVRSVAESLSAAGHHAQALRIVATLFWKSAFTPSRRDAELYWPRPWRDEFAAAASGTGLDEFLLYGLARSESAFDPVAVSKSGAVGLIQLMPATAAEMAGRLRLDAYDLTDPEDNLALGSAYFARVLGGVGGRALPAVFSYNGGPTRFKRWEAEYGNLPLDLMLEALSYAETRQYGRNVATAALSYAALYGEGDIREYFAYLLGEGPVPASGLD